MIERHAIGDLVDLDLSSGVFEQLVTDGTTYRVPLHRLPFIDPLRAAGAALDVSAAAIRPARISAAAMSSTFGCHSMAAVGTGFS